MRIVFGAGFTGARVAELALSTGESVLAVVRSEESVLRLSARGISATRERAEVVAREHVSSATHAIVCFPPDGETDDALAPLLAKAGAVTYVSTTGVYGGLEGVIDDATPLPPPSSESMRARLAAEKAYRDVGGTILRAPGIYGPERGLHVRIQKGLHVIPGDGSNPISHIHVDDLAALVLSSRAVRGETFVVSDLGTATQREMVDWICAEYNCPTPKSAPPEEVHESLRRNRRIDGSRARQVLGVPLRFPTFRQGMRRER